MVAFPSAVIFVNNDLVDSARNHIITQLHINEFITGTEFDSRIAADSGYVNKIKQLNLRLLVIRPFTETTNRNLADVVAFVKNGMIAVETNKFGPPAPAFPVLDVHWGQFCIFGNFLS